MFYFALCAGTVLLLYMLTIVPSHYAKQHQKAAPPPLTHTHPHSHLSPQECLLDFLRLMGDPDRHVRKAAVVALSAVVHHKPGLVTAGLQQLLPLLFDQTVIKPEMVRHWTGLDCIVLHCIALWCAVLCYGVPVCCGVVWCGC